MNLVQNSRSYWEALTLWAVFLRFFRLDSSKYVLEFGHVLDEGVWIGLNDLIESDSGQVAFDCLVLELLLAKVADELAEYWFRCREGPGS